MAPRIWTATGWFLVLVMVVLAGAVFSAALACSFQAALLRLRRSIRAVASGLGLSPAEGDG